MKDPEEVSGWDDEPEPELLTSAADRHRVDERVDTGIRRGGRFARQHPWWMAGIVAVLAGSVALGVHVARLSPPVDPVVHISIQSLGGQGRYVAELRTPADRVRVLGIVGPGLGGPTSSMGTVTATEPGVGVLGARLDCSQEGWWDATPEDYRARVERTDAYGRVTTYDAPVEETLDSWYALVHRECLKQALLTLPRATADVRAGPGPKDLDVTVQVANPGAHGIHFLIRESGDDAFGWPLETEVDLPAEASTDFVLRMRIDCRERVLTLPRLTLHAAGTAHTGPGIPVVIPYGSDEESQFASSMIPIDVAAEAAINAAAAAACS